MKETPIIFTTQLIPKILDGSKTQTRRVIKPSNSEVGEGKVDWTKFCWDGTEIHIDKCFTPNCDHKHEVKAPLPFVDTGFPNPTTGQLDSWYLHVPYHWADGCTIFRIYPKWQVGHRLWVRETHYRYGKWVKNGLTKTGRQRWRFKAFTNNIYYIENPPTGVQPNSYREEGWYKRSSLFMPRWASRITLEITNIRVERLQEIDQHDIDCEGNNNTAMTNGERLRWFIELWNSLNPKYSWESNPWVWVIEFRKV